MLAQATKNAPFASDLQLITEKKKEMIFSSCCDEGNRDRLNSLVGLSLIHTLGSVWEWE